MFGKYSWSILLLAIAIVGCTQNTSVDTIDGEKMYHYNDPKVQNPDFARNQLKVRNVVKKQVQRDDFNGIFYMTPTDILIEQDYWSGEFNRLSQPGFYGKFFNEFRLQMKKLGTYYGSDPQRERMMASAERSFYEFCVSMNIGEQYRSWKNEIGAW